MRSMAQDIAIEIARQEYEEEGIVSTTAYLAMTLAGLDADRMVEIIEEEN